MVLNECIYVYLEFPFKTFQNCEALLLKMQYIHHYWRGRFKNQVIAAFWNIFEKDWTDIMYDYELNHLTNRQYTPFILKQLIDELCLALSLFCFLHFYHNHTCETVD